MVLNATANPNENEPTMKKEYDVVVIGSGLGGLVSAIILAKEGYRVGVLEKNNQFGGNLQTFVRDKTIFDTGIHYMGGLEKGQNLYQYFKYIGIMDDLKLHKMDTNAYDVVSFGDDPTDYPHAQGYENFVAQLLPYFPEEKKALEVYCEELRRICDSFPLYNLNFGGGYSEELLSINTNEFLNALTTNVKLRAVLAGSNFLYAGIEDKTPLYVHALSVNSYIQSAWRCINGGSQITKQLIKQLKKYGGEVYKYKEVTGFGFEGEALVSAKVNGTEEVFGKIFISNIEPKTTLQMIGPDKFRKPFYKRVQGLETVPSAFSLYIVFKPESFPYFNHNYYHFKESAEVWKANDYTEDTWPKAFMVSMNIGAKTEQWAESMTAITYMNFEDVQEWEATENTTAKAKDRGAGYEAFKEKKIEKFLKSLELKFPGIRETIRSVHASTPLSYRDYIGGHRGNLYGYIKDSHNPMKTFITPRTKVPNLFLTGQSISMHGVLGVTIGAVVTCSEIVGKEYLINKINAEVQTV